jgi:glycosyltransferase involved in cell wall biosynthesis
VAVVDLGGYPYPLALARSLARRGHDVLHVAMEGIVPRTSLAARKDDPPTLHLRRVSPGGAYAKYRFTRRWMQEQRLSLRVPAGIAAFGADAVLMSNTPLDVQAAIRRDCDRRGVTAIVWLQDLIGVATDAYLRDRLPVVGRLVGWWYRRMEDRLLRKADHVVAITSDFVALLRERGVDPGRITVVENWAPLSELPVLPRDNAWARRHDLVGRLVFVYAGTLGLKHRPDLLVELADAMRHDPDVRIVVCSEGPAMDLLQREQQLRRLPNLVLLPFQPYDAVPAVMASGDVLVALLEPTAAGFSVPSKVQTYLCAARPLLVAIPSGNLAAELVTGAECGIAVEPHETAAFLDGAHALAADREVRSVMGDRARALAERLFDQEAITDRFEEVLRTAAVRSSGAARRG